MSNQRSDVRRPTRPFTPEEVALLVDRAGRAPSVHNTQPWFFRAYDSVLELHVDAARALPVADPQGRERLVSCGAALFNLLLTMRHLGHEPLVTPFPDGPSGPRLALIARGPGCVPTAGETGLYAAIPGRRTQRRPFDGRRLTEPERGRLTEAATAENLWVDYIDDPLQRRQMAQLMATAAADTAADPAYRAELGGWIRTRGSRCDGIPLPSLGAARSPAVGLPRPDGIAGLARPDGIGGIAGLARPGSIADEPLAQLVEEELSRSTVLVLGTLRDTPRDWLDTGQGVQRVLLQATRTGLGCSFANQLIELPEMRAKLSTVLGATGYPQLILRVGHPLVDVPATPRRSSADLFPRLR